SGARAALARALGWAAREGMTVEGGLSTAELQALCGVFARDAKSTWTSTWRPALDEPLRVFAHAYLRLSGGAGLPPVTAGDAAAALNELRLADQGGGWALDPAPGAAAFEALGFAETSLGIARVERENSDGWREHARQHKSLFEQAAAQLPGRTAAVIG